MEHLWWLLLIVIEMQSLQMFFKIGALKSWWWRYSANFTNFIEKTQTQVLSCEILKNFKNVFFYKTPPVTDLEYRQVS